MAVLIASRRMYNDCLQELVEHYKATGKHMNLFEQDKKHGAKEHPDLPAIVVDTTLKRLHRSFANFFRGRKEGKRIGFRASSPRTSGTPSNSETPPTAWTGTTSRHRRSAAAKSVSTYIARRTARSSSPASSCGLRAGTSSASPTTRGNGWRQTTRPWAWTWASPISWPIATAALSETQSRSAPLPQNWLMPSKNSQSVRKVAIDAVKPRGG